jgi:thiol-disulfide isomerase/thioredoxin
MRYLILILLSFILSNSLLALDLKISNDKPNENSTIELSLTDNELTLSDLYLISYRFKDSSKTPVAESMLVINGNISFSIQDNDNFILFKLIDKDGNIYNNHGEYWQINIYQNSKPKYDSKLNEAVTYLGTESANYSRKPKFNKINNALVEEIDNYPNNVRAKIAYETFKLDFKLIDYKEYKKSIENILNTKINITDDLTIRSVISALNSINETEKSINLEEKFIDNNKGSDLYREKVLDNISTAEDYDDFVKLSIAYLNKYNNLKENETVYKSFAYAHTQSKEYYDKLYYEVEKLSFKSTILYKYIALGLLRNNDLETELGKEKYQKDIEIGLKNAFSKVNDLDSIKPRDLSIIEFDDYKDKIRSDLFLISYRLDLLKNDSSSAFQNVYEAINKAPFQMNARLYNEAVILSSKNGSTSNTKEILRQAYMNDVIDSDLAESILKIINSNNDISIDYVNEILNEKQKQFEESIEANLVNEDVSGIIKSLDGKYKDLSDLGDGIHIVSITSTWCDVCEETFPVLNVLNNKYTDVKILGISVWGDDDEENQLSKIIKENSIEYEYFLDKTDIIPRKFDLFGFPTILIIDEKNKLRYTVRGFKSEDSLDNTIETVLDLIQ